MEDLTRLPTDVEVRLMSVQMEFLNNQYSKVEMLYKSHEVEIALLWCMVLGLGIAVSFNLYQNYRRDHPHE